MEELWPDPDGPGAVRVIAPDRPGIGGSDFQPGRRLAHSPRISRPWLTRWGRRGSWHGEADTNVPVAMARRIAQLVPGAQLTVYPEEGHLVAATHWDEIIGALM